LQATAGVIGYAHTLVRTQPKYESIVRFLVGSVLVVDTLKTGIDLVRKRSSRVETSLEETNEPTALERIHDTLLSSYLQRMVASLPKKQRIVVVLRYQEGLEPEEIAELLEMNVSTVKTQIARALDLLRAKTAGRLKQKWEVECSLLRNN